MEKKLKIHYIHPDFEEFIKEGYLIHKDNDKIHRIKAADKKKKIQKNTIPIRS